MTYKTRQNWKDLVEKPDHPTITRRDLLARGMATGFMSLGVSNALAGELIKKAMADTTGSVTCTQTKSPGCIAQIYADGGPTMGARFLSTQQMNYINNPVSGATIATNYGVTSVTNIGANLNVDPNSPFGAVLLAGPPGYPGGSAAWKTNVLSRVSAGGHLGPFNQDDGAGEDSGLIGGVSPFLSSPLGKDIVIGNGSSIRAPAAWANGLPNVQVAGTLTPNSLAKTFTMTPAPTNLVTTGSMAAASTAATQLAQNLSTLTGTATRKAASVTNTNATCAFVNNSAMASSGYGAALFSTSGISSVTTSSLTNEEQAQLAAFYQSAKGVAGGVILQFSGRDYHGQSAAQIGSSDIEEARSIVMFLAACDAAGAPGSLIYLSNGQAIANGNFGATTFNTNTADQTTGGSITVNPPMAVGDAGGAYNAGLALFIAAPGGSPPQTMMTGTVNAATGVVTPSSNVTSSAQAVAGLYLSALNWVNGSIPQSALTKMQANGVSVSSTNTSSLMVFSS